MVRNCIFKNIRELKILGIDCLIEKECREGEYLKKLWRYNRNNGDELGVRIRE